MIDEYKLGRMVKVYKNMTDSDKKEVLLERMIEENKGFIYKIITPFYCDKFEIEELYNEAVSAFIQAIKYYNPNYKPKDGKGKAKVTTYFFKFIWGKMQNYVRINGRDFHTEHNAYSNYTTYKETVYKMIMDSLGKKPTDKEVLQYFQNHNIQYVINNKSKFPWNEEKIKLMKLIDAQTEPIHYNNPINSDGDEEMFETIADNTIERPDLLARRNSDKILFEKISNEFCKKSKNIRVFNIIKLRYGYLNPYLKELIMQTIDRVGIENFGKISESEKLTLQQISFIYGITKENARVLSDIGLRQLQILAGTIPEIEIKEEHRFPFINRDLDIKPQQLKDVEFVDYDTNIISINTKNGYISAKKQGDTNLVILDHINDREITYHIKVTPKYKDNEYNRYKAKKLALRKEANNE